MQKITNTVEIKEFLFRNLFQESEINISQIKPKISLFKVPINIKKGVDYTQHYLDFITMGVIFSSILLLILLLTIQTKLGIIHQIHWSFTVLSLTFFAISLFLYLNYKVSIATEISMLLKVYDDYKNTKNDFYESMLTLYNYDKNDLGSIINKMSEVRYNNDAQQEFSRIVLILKKKQLDSVDKQDEINKIIKIKKEPTKTSEMRVKQF